MVTLTVKFVVANEARVDLLRILTLDNGSIGSPVPIQETKSS
jgi:hypothetical protein